MENIINNFSILFDSTEKVKNLREIILSLAVRGKLAKQDPGDEPASVLLERIKEEKEKLVKAKKIKKSKPLPAVTEDEIPFKLPKGWEWVRLGEIINIYSGEGLTKRKMNKTGNIPVFGGNGITGYHDDYNVSKETVVIGRVGYHCGNIHLTKEKAWVTDNAFITTYPEESICRNWLIWLLKGINLKENDNATAQPVISGAKIYPIVFPLPPLNEQKRIVKKVDQLMVLCDELESNLKNKAHYKELASKSLSDAIQNSKDKEKLISNLKMLINNFKEVYTTKENINDLKSTILQLAVQGKLVSQDPNDEPASVLLERIKEEKEKLVKAKKIKKSKPLPAVTEDEIPFELPKGWEWVRLGEVTNYGYRESVKPNNITDDEWILELEDIEKDSSKILQRVFNKKRNAKSNKNKFYKNDVLYGKLRPYLKKIIVADSEGVCSTEIIPLRGYYGIKPEYLMYTMKTSYFDDFVNEITYGMSMPRLGTNDGRKLLFPLPPLNEQKRIVKKVDQLMALCDELEKQIDEKKKHSEMLMKSVLNEAFKS